MGDPKRPDVEGIAAWARTDYRHRGFHKHLQGFNALITYIEALEAVIQQRNDTDQKVWEEAQEAVDELNRLDALAPPGKGDS